jgi:hypothetical protein
VCGIAAISYGLNEHKTNPFVSGDLEAQGQLVRKNPELADYYKREKRPVTLPWQPGQNNLTELGRLTTLSPHLAKLANRAAELQRQMIAKQIAAAKADEADAARKRHAAEKLLQ